MRRWSWLPAGMLLIGCTAARAQPPEGCPSRGQWPQGMSCVPGGTFTVGSSRGRPDEAPPGEVSLRSFYLDVTEVTNADYRACMEAGVCPPHARYRGFLRQRQPVVGVSWPAARAFCAWRDRRLPTDAEFERAATGIEGTRFPWGNETDHICDRTVIRTRAGTGCGQEVTALVGTRPAGHFGIHDLAGNVHEWVFDRYSPCLNGCRHACGDACFGSNPRGPCAGESTCRGHPLRSIRGGSWYWPLERARASARRGAHPENRAGHRFGFRCARDLEPSNPPSR